MVKLTIGFLFLIVAVSVIYAKECEVGQTKTEDCNTCVCANGLWACTRRFCRGERAAAPECKEGETKQVECNSCHCTNGIFACTKKFCINKREANAEELKEEDPRQKREVTGAADLATTPCAPNDYFQVECNTCYCKTDRTGYLCTDNNCHEDLSSLSTTTHIPLSNDSMLVISNYGVELLEHLNSNDNSLSRIPKSANSDDLGTGSDADADPNVGVGEDVDGATDENVEIITDVGVDVTTNAGVDTTTDVPPAEVDGDAAVNVDADGTEDDDDDENPDAGINTGAGAVGKRYGSGTRSGPRSPLILSTEQRRLAAAAIAAAATSRNVTDA